MYSTHTFTPQSDTAEMKRFAEKLYPSALLPLQRSGDAINAQFATTGIAVAKNDEIAGRVVLYSGTGISIDRKRTLILGNYECVNDPLASAKLFDAVEETARQESCEILLGPMNGTTWDNYRFCTNVEAGNFFSEMVHLPWYSQQWKENGFRVFAEYVSSIDRDLNWQIPEWMAREQSLVDAGMIFRNIDLQNYDQELIRLFAFSESAFRKNFLYTPTNWDTFREKYIAIQKWIHPDMVWIAERNGEMAGFCFCLPDHLCTTEKRMVLKTIARLDHPELKGLGAVIGNKATRYAKENNYDAVIHALMHRENYSLNLSAQFTGRPFKQYELYVKHL